MAARITLRQVQAFRLIMTNRTMTIAAEQMSISQPAVSRLISDLEETLDLKLFERIGPRLLPTAAARRLIGEVDRVFLGLDFVEEAARRIRRFALEPYRLAVPPFLSYSFAAKLVARVSVDIPDLAISLHSDTSRAIAEQVSRGEHDLGICMPGRWERELNVLSRHEVETVCLLPADHPLAERPRIIPEDLDGISLYVLGRSGAIRPQINEVFAQRQIAPRIVGEMQHALSCAAFVSQGLGVALLDSVSARSADQSRTTIRPFVPRIDLEIALITSSRHVRSDVDDAFLAHIPQALVECT
ncbi:LysR substrate-binding domain-containing protein [Stappia indica]|uniref:LysR family transcriptional regulator n=1 Tax=Stappia indica TaxID=538381 RepID=A0A857CC39_9HYPH|nr:LysR substrate-binding domain-containing protein [Stappia indica]QGZ36590.1 LysR family transcriptional regulator [Stappia indica]